MHAAATLNGWYTLWYEYSIKVTPRPCNFVDHKVARMAPSATALSYNLSSTIKFVQLGEMDFIISKWYVMVKEKKKENKRENLPPRKPQIEIL